MKMRNNLFTNNLKSLFIPYNKPTTTKEEVIESEQDKVKRFGRIPMQRRLSAPLVGLSNNNKLNNLRDQF